MTKQKLTYKETGVSYDAMDPLKRMAQIGGKKTVHNINNSSFKELSISRGESAYVLEQDDCYFAFVMEGLGTKNLVADAMRKITGKMYYAGLAQDTVAMIVNDLIVVGARPITVLAYWAAGSAKWFEDLERMQDLVDGWEQACTLSCATWGGGETPTLAGIISPETLDLGGSSFGIISPKERLVTGEKLAVEDAIILFESSGIHANGLSLARKIAGNLPEGYETKIGDGRMYGEAILDPTIIYVKLVQELFENNVDIHYMVNITGHGWRKLMRHNAEFTYRMTMVPPVPAVLEFMVEHGPLEISEAYGNLNMGAGFAVMVPEADVEKVLKVAKECGIAAWNAGTVDEGPKKVVIEPKEIVFEGESLQVRA
jgi:phosphoribosylformylglycinamidine cyclo-ligase